MESHPWDDDGVLLALADALRPSQSPAAEGIRAGGSAAFSFRTMDEELELVSLVYDSLLDEAAGTGRRAATSSRTLVFGAGDVSIEIEIDGLRLVGQITPPTAGTVSAEYSTGRRVVHSVDDLGCFALPLTAGGTVRLHVDTEHGNVVTEWVALPHRP